MSSTADSTHEFPSPIGGVPYPSDFVPSILFSFLHGILIPIFIWRLVRSRTRTYVLIGVFCFTIERTIFYALRAYASNHDGSRESKALETYFQTTLAGGYITLGQDLMNLARALLVNATKGSEVLDREAKVNKNHRPDCGSDASYLATLDLVDHPKARGFIRRTMFVATILFLVTITVGIIASVDYQKVLKSGAHADVVRTLWNISAALALSLLMGLAHGVIWGCYAIRRVPRRSTIWIVVLATIVSVAPIYRLYVLRFSTTSLLSDAPGSLNSSQSKATFYLFHSTPEFLAATILISLDARRIFNAGLWGDRRRRDPERRS